MTTALNRLRDAGVGGPFAVALSERCYAELTEATDGGYPVLEHVRRLIDGPLVWAPGLDGAVVLSMRGEDFELTVGQDFSIGYLDHDAERVRLYIEESFTFWLRRRRPPCRWRFRRQPRGNPCRRAGQAHTEPARAPASCARARTGSGMSRNNAQTTAEMTHRNARPYRPPA